MLPENRSFHPDADAMNPPIKTRLFQLLLPILSLTITLPCSAQDGSEDDEKAKQKMAEGVRKNLAAYDTVEGSLEAGPVTVRTRLGESVSDAGEGEVYDGIRFTAPKDLKGKDFVWYFNAPTAWASWYIVPVKGDFEGGFQNWIDADCLYSELDQAEDKDRQRTLQSLEGSYFESGREYVLWFRRADRDAGQNLEVRAVLAFAPLPADEKKWDADSIEDALKLKRATAADQVKFLNSRGGRAMLDKELFDPSDAKGRIDDVISAIRTTSRTRGGFFVTMEMACPPCKKSPKMEEVIARHGPPDCVITSAERMRVRKHGRDEPVDEEDENLVQHFYDYFAFETESGDSEGRVQRVRTHASNFGMLSTPEKGGHVRAVGMKNLNVFYQDRKEVGRMYFFMEGPKNPLVIQEPPVGKYEMNENSMLNYEGGGKWQWLSLKGDKVVRRIPLENHMLHGMGEGFYDNGKPSFRAPYEKGQLHGEVIEMNDEGVVTSRRMFRDGKRIEAEEGARSSGKPK